MPAMRALEFTSNQRFVTMRRYFIAVGHGVHVHARFGKFRVQTAIVRVPEQRRRADERHIARRFELRAKFGEPVGNLFSTFEFASRHGILNLLRFLRPSVFQRNRPVEDELSGRAVFIQSEVGEALKLIAEFRFRVFQTWLQFRGHYFE